MQVTTVLPQTLTQIAQQNKQEIDTLINEIKEKKKQIENDLNSMDSITFSYLPKVYVIGRECLKYLKFKKKSHWTYVDYIVIETSFWQFGKRIIKFKWNQCDRSNTSNQDKVDCYFDMVSYNNNLDLLDKDSLEILYSNLNHFEKFLIESLKKR